ncbi:tetratricopeptide repeat protein [Streptomyces sp. ID05-26A]|nr:tetratricopeptide repeat protein [Streptomyces sp. ID05-26A]
MERGPLVIPVADCYRRAVLDGADMTRVVPAVEAVRATAAGRDELPYFSGAITGVIATNTDKNAHEALSELRARCHDLLYERVSRQLDEAFDRSPDEGWRLWRTMWVRGMWDWPEAVWRRLLLAPCPVRERDAAELAELCAAGLASLDSRWGETYDVMKRLSREDWLPPVALTYLVENLAMVELYVFRRHTAARELLDRAEALGGAPDRVRTGWSEWWLEQASSEDSDERDALGRAWEIARAVVEADPHTRRGWSVLGRVLEKVDPADRRNEQPEGCYRSVIAEGEIEGWAYLVKLEVQQSADGLSDSGVAMLIDMALRTWPEKKHYIYMRLADAAELKADLDSADFYHRAAIEHAPDQISGYVARGYARFDAGDVETARAMFATATELAPNSADTQFGSAWFHEQLGEWAIALPHYQNARRLHPGWAATFTARIGACLDRLGRIAEAEHELVTGLRRFPGDTNLVAALEDLATGLYQERNSTESARRLFGTIREICGETYEGSYLNLLGNMRYWLEDYQAAEQQFQLSLAAGNTSPVIQSNIARAREGRFRTGEFDQLPLAIESLRQAVALAPDRDEYHTRLEALERQADLMRRYGQAVFDRVPVVRPIRVEVSDEWLPIILVPETTELSATLQQKITAMRDQVERETGVWLPGIRMSTLTSWAPGNVRCTLSGAAVRVGVLPTSELFCDAPLEQVRPLAPSARPAGTEGTIIAPEHASAVADAGLTVLPPEDYLLRWAQEVILGHLAEFVGHDEMAHRLSTVSTENQPAVDLGTLTGLVRRRLRRGEPVLDLASVTGQRAVVAE